MRILFKVRDWKQLWGSERGFRFRQTKFLWQIPNPERKKKVDETFNPRKGGSKRRNLTASTHSISVNPYLVWWEQQSACQVSTLREESVKGCWSFVFVVVGVALFRSNENNILEWSDETRLPMNKPQTINCGWGARHAVGDPETADKQRSDDK